MTTPKPQPTPKPTRTPHLLHVTARGMHLHWALGSSSDEIQRAGKAARAFAGHDLYRAASDPVQIKQVPGFYEFGVGDDGNALVGRKVMTL